MTQASSAKFDVSGKAYLLTASDGTSQVLSQFSPADQLIFDSSTADLMDLRQVINKSQLRSWGGARLLLIKDAHLLTDIMQNTLLKLLEEPASDLTIVLATTQPQRLLSTVMSRLGRWPHRGQTHFPARATDGQKVNLISPELLKLDRDRVVAILKDQLSQELSGVLAHPTTENCHRVEQLDLAIRKLRQNANLKLVIDYLLLHWETESEYMSN